MNVATFGELIRPAREHLAAAQWPEELDAATALAAAQATARIARTLSRYLGDVAPYRVVETVASPVLPDWVRAAVDSRQALRAAAGTLRGGIRSAGEVAGVDDLADAGDAPLVAHLRAAGDGLAAGRDLLWTHHAVGQQRELTGLSEWAAVTSSADLTRAVLAETARWSRDLAFLVWEMPPPARAGQALPAALRDGLVSSCHWLLTGSGKLAGYGNQASAADMWLLESVSVRHVPARRPPGGAETRTDLVDGVTRSAARLRASRWEPGLARTAAWSPAMTAESWRWTASASAAICHLSAEVLGTLTAHPQLDAMLPGGGPVLVSAGEQAVRAWQGWRQVARSWGLIVTDTTGLTGPGLADLGDLTLQLGRLSFADPAWTPARKDAAPLRGPQELAADQAGVGEVVVAVHQALDAVVCVAQSDRDAVRVAIEVERLHLPTRMLPGRYDVPYKFGPLLPSVGVALLDAYDAVRGAAKDAVVALDAVAVAAQASSVVLGAARVAGQSGAAAVLDERVEAELAAGAGTGPGVGQGEIVAGAGGQAGRVEREVRALSPGDLSLLLRARAIDRATDEVIRAARVSGSHGRASRQLSSSAQAGAAATRDVAAVSFPQQSLRSARPASGRRQLAARADQAVPVARARRRS